jgi:hypothetical protein
MHIRGHFSMLDARPVLLQWRALGLFERLLEILTILSQAASASHLYDDLSHQCDGALAERGLKRADLPRAAYNELTKGY